MLLTAAKACSTLEAQGMGPLYSHRDYLNKAGLLPVKGRGITAAVLGSLDLTRLVIGATAGRAVDAGQQVAMAGALKTESGATLGAAVKAIFDGSPENIDAVELGVTSDGTFAWIRRKSGETEMYGKPRAAYRATIFSGGVLGALATGMHFPTDSGWTDPRPE